jgi:hypothetical protein
VRRQQLEVVVEHLHLGIGRWRGRRTRPPCPPQDDHLRRRHAVIPQIMPCPR